MPKSKKELIDKLKLSATLLSKAYNKDLLTTGEFWTCITAIKEAIEIIEGVQDDKDQSNEE